MREGYTFAGWNTAADGSGDVFTAETQVSSDVTVYAQWVKDEPDVPGIVPPVVDDEPDDVVPPMLNGDDHFAYVIGYEDGTFRPDNRITRAEARNSVVPWAPDAVHLPPWRVIMLRTMARPRPVPGSVPAASEARALSPPRSGGRPSAGCRGCGV